MKEGVRVYGVTIGRRHRVSVSNKCDWGWDGGGAEVSH